MEANQSKGSKRSFIAILTVCLLTLGALTSLFMMDEDAEGATSIGTISLSGGATRTYTAVNYLLDGDILVTGTGTKLTFIDSMITLSQDVGMDGELGGGDDHIYTIEVENGGTLEMKNSDLTTQTDQLHPYFALTISIDGSGSVLSLEDTVIEGPGTMTVSNGGKLIMDTSAFVELNDKTGLGYDIDGDGSTVDDQDYNDDGLLLTMESGARAVITDSELRDTFSFTTASRDGLLAGNITLTGTGTNLTVVNSFLDIDLESNLSTGSHNRLKLSGGAIAHLVGASINTSSQTSSAAILVTDSTSKAIYYRWIAARVLDGVDVPVENIGVRITRVEGSQNRVLTGSYLTSEVLSYMQRTSLTWNQTGTDGWAFIPVVTDLFTYSSMPNSDVTPDFQASLSLSGETVSPSASFNSYPSLPAQGEQSGVIGRIIAGEDTGDDIATDLDGPMKFHNFVATPSTSSFFSGTSMDLTVTSRTLITGTSAMVNGVFYPSYYSFDGHLKVGTGGHLIINDTVVNFLTDNGPAYILIENGGKMEMNNVTLASVGTGGLYAYVLGSGSPSMTLNEGSISLDNLISRTTGQVHISGSSFNGSLNLYGTAVSTYISASQMSIGSVFAKDCSLNLSGGPISIGELEWSKVTFGSQDSTIDIILDVDKTAELLNVTFSGTLPDGRTSWVNAVGSGVVTRSYWASARVEDSVGNKLGGSTLNVYRVVGSSSTLLSSEVTDDEGTSVFPLLQDEIRSTGKTYLGNYRLVASFRGYSSSPYSAVLSGQDVNAVVRIPGGPNLMPKALLVDGALIAGNPVVIEANVTNDGRFDSGPVPVQLFANEVLVGESNVSGIVSNTYSSAFFDWVSIEGQVEFMVKVDPMNIQKETFEDDNVLTQMNIIGLGPDYSISMTPQEGDWVFGVESQIDITVTNIGEVDPTAAPFTVDVTWEALSGSGDVELGVAFDYIPPGEVMTQTISWAPEAAGGVSILAEVKADYDQVPLNSLDTAYLIVKMLPDIVFVEGSFNLDSPIPVTVNTTTTVSFELTNVGEMPTGSFRVALYDTVVDESHKVDLESLVTELQPGMTVPLSFIWFAAPPLGEHELIVVMDIDRVVMEQFESNNNVTFPVKVDTPPDITFTTNVGASPKIVTEGKNITFWATVKNIGRTMARSLKVHFTLDNDQTIISTKTLSLVPDQMANLSMQWNAAGPGSHTLFIVADPNDDIIEPQETNNLVSYDFTILTRPDLFMNPDDLRFLPETNIEIGDEVRINATIRNSGETDANNVFVRFYDGDPDLGGRIIAWTETQPSVSISTLKAGRSAIVEVIWTPRTGGPHTIFVVMDLIDYIDESNEDNNKADWEIYVKTLPDPNLVAINFVQGGFWVDSAGVGKNLVINLTIDNDGDMSTPEMTIGFFNGEFENDPMARLIGAYNTYPAGTIAPHSRMHIEMPWTVSYPKGARTIFATVELVSGEEQTANNNIVFAPLEIFDIEDVPELYPEDGTLLMNSKFEGMSPGENGFIGYMGDNITVTANISNIGGKAASNTTIFIMVSNSTDTWVEYSTQIRFLENNGTDLFIGYWNIRHLGVNTIEVVVDPDNMIKEFYEGNNILTREVTVLEAPDLKASIVRIKPYNTAEGRYDMTKGKEYEIAFDIENTGNFTYSNVEVWFNGPSTVSKQYVTVGPADTASAIRRVTFTVKPTSTGESTWKLKINDKRTVYESAYNNNDITVSYKVKEPEKEISILLIVLIVALILLLIMAVIGFLAYRKYQAADKAKCSNCGGLVDIDAEICPHCGIEFSEELECECGELIPAGALECPACHRPVRGEPLEEGEEPAEGEPQKEKEEGEEEGKDEGEEEAGKKEAPDRIDEMEEVAEEETPKPSGEEELAECFECGALIPVSAPICPHCGAVFE